MHVHHRLRFLTFPMRSLAGPAVEIITARVIAFGEIHRLDTSLQRTVCCGESYGGTAAARSHGILPANTRRKPRSTTLTIRNSVRLSSSKGVSSRTTFEMTVILQTDGSLACLPAWMLAESAAQHRICQSPTISLAFLQSLRVDIANGRAPSLRGHYSASSLLPTQPPVRVRV